MYTLGRVLTRIRVSCVMYRLTGLQVKFEPTFQSDCAVGPAELGDRYLLGRSQMQDDSYIRSVLVSRSLRALMLIVSTHVVSTACCALDDPPEPKQGEAPREQFEALLNEYRRAGEFFVREMSEARTIEDRDKVRKEKYPDPVSYSARFLAIADRAVGEAVEVESLIWCAQLGTRSPGGVKAIERLATAHAQDVRIVRIIDSLPCIYSPSLEDITLACAYSPPPEKLLRAIISATFDRDARGRATFVLGQLIVDRAEFLRHLKGEPKRLERVRSLMASLSQESEALDRLIETEPEVLIREGEVLFEETLKNFADVRQGSNTLGGLARNELYEIRVLGIGKPCPEIRGRDLHGKPFKLSDYKGKVVIVEFWGDW